LFSPVSDSADAEPDDRKLGWGVILELEWHIPWDAGWTPEKKLAATQKIADYMTTGTILETGTRMRVTKADVVEPFKDADPEAKVRRDPFIRFRLEH
jgi:hypothetical protein